MILKNGKNTYVESYTGGTQTPAWGSPPFPELLSPSSFAILQLHTIYVETKKRGGEKGTKSTKHQQRLKVLVSNY